MRTIRRISTIELLYEDVQRATNTYAIEYAFTVHKVKDLKAIENAINKVAANCPGFHVCLRHGRFYPCKEPITIQKHRAKKKDLCDFDFINKKLDLKNGSIEAHYAVTGGREYLVLRFAHSVLDGKGTLMFMQNVANVLNNKPLLPCSNEVRERDFLKKLAYYKKQEPKLPYIKHAKSHKIKDYDVVWDIIEIDGYVTSVIAKLACIIADEFENNETRMMIPVDLRRYDRSSNYIGNLTLPIFLKVRKNDNYKRVNGQLLSSLKDKEELNYSNTLPAIYCHMPRIIRAGIVKAGCVGTNMSGKFSIGALISHLGRINLDDYANKYFKIDDFASFPVQQPMGAFSMVIVEHSHKTRIVFSYYKHQFDEKYINELIAKIKRLLTEWEEA